MSYTHETIESVSAKLLGLAPGSLAELRRMEPEGAGTPIFWRMAAEYGFRDADLATWKRVIRILALLTPSGNRNSEVRLHERKRRLGTVLCDGGDPAWPPAGSNATPVFSEQRLARLLAIPAAQRGESLERIARMLAHSRTPQSGVNCNDIACLLLYPDKAAHLEDVALHYYARLDRAANPSKNEKGTD